MNNTQGEQQFRLLAENAPVLIRRARPDRECDYVNATWLRFTGRPLERELGWGWADNLHPEDQARCLDAYAAAFDVRQPFSMEYRMRRHDGLWRWLLDNGVPYRTPAGAFAGFIGSATDITEQKQATQEERELMQREVQHRVRNNLQIVSSLLGLQGRAVRNPAARRALGAAQRRVLVLARVQEQLDEAARPDGTVEIAAHLRRFCADLAAACSDRRRCVIVVEAEERLLPADQAVTLSLILDELVANACEHAYAAHETNAVAVRFATDPAGEARLTVADQGAALPEAFDPAAGGGLGLQLVQALLASLGGRLEIERAPLGKRFAVTFRPG